MIPVGLIGWRGMVGSVLIERMRAERDFDLIEPAFFSTTQAGGKGPAIGKDVAPVGDARDLKALAANDILISCQGSDYTGEVYPKLRAAGWNGFWIDAARTLRMNDDAVIVLDPVNLPLIQGAIATTFNSYYSVRDFDDLILAFDNGLTVEVADDMDALRYVHQVSHMDGMRDALGKLGVAGNPQGVAAGVEFILEGLHLNRKLNKDELGTTGGGARYQS